MKSHKALSFLAAACLCLSAAPLPVMADFSRTNCSYYYDKLDTDAQMLYNNLYAAALKVDTSDAYYAYAPEAYYTGLTDEQMEDIVVLFTYDHPEFFWLANYYQYGWSWNGSYVSLQVYPDFQDGSERQTARTRLQEVEKGYVAGAMPGLPRRTRSLPMHRVWIRSLCTVPVTAGMRLRSLTGGIMSMLRIVCFCTVTARSAHLTSVSAITPPPIRTARRSDT